MTTVAQALLVAPILRQEIFWNKVVLSQTLAAGGVGDASGEQGEAKKGVRGSPCGERGGEG